MIDDFDRGQKSVAHFLRAARGTYSHFPPSAMSDSAIWSAATGTRRTAGRGMTASAAPTTRTTTTSSTFLARDGISFSMADMPGVNIMGLVSSFHEEAGKVQVEFWIWMIKKPRSGIGSNTNIRTRASIGIMCTLTRTRPRSRGTCSCPRRVAHIRVD